MGMVNRWTFSGYLTADAQAYETRGGGFECLAHVHIPTNNERHAWAAVIWRGKKAQAAFDRLKKGALLFVDGSVGPRDAVSGDAIIVNATSVIIGTDAE